MTAINTIQLERGPHDEKDPNDYRDEPEKARRILSTPKPEQKEEFRGGSRWKCGKCHRVWCWTSLLCKTTS